MPFSLVLSLFALQVVFQYGICSLNLLSLFPPTTHTKSLRELPTCIFSCKPLMRSYLPSLRNHATILEWDTAGF